jgi:uncharacterized RmlC-like cupin family protein
MSDSDGVQEYWKSGVEYRRFMEEQDIPIHEGYYVDDIYTCEVEYWDRLGVDGAFAHLEGHKDGFNGLYILEIPAGESTTVQQHLYEINAFTATGHGVTTIGEGDDESMFEWEENAVFAIPRNRPYQITNLSSEPARIVINHDLPPLLALFKDPAFVFDNDHVFPMSQTAEEYSSEGNMYTAESFPVVWESNFIPDIDAYDRMEHWQERGAGGVSVEFSHPDTSIWAHLSQFPKGTYKKAHRHNGGSNVIILEGEGYTFMWQDDFDDRVRIDWSPGTLFVPPTLWWHPHFNLSTESPRYFALHPPSPIAESVTAMDGQIESNNIQYPDEDPRIREIFEQELAERGIESRMPDEAYEDPNYSFEQNYKDMMAESDDD